jgi:hypothetical protein
MKSTTSSLQRIAELGLIVMLGASMSAQAGIADGTSWKEEVLLHDGSKIIVERSVVRGGRHEIGQLPPYKEQSLTFAMPGTTKKITWEDKFSEDVGSANFLPMLLDTQNDTAYLVVSPMGCLSYNKWGRPNPPYVVFKYQGKTWRRIALKELPADIKTPNLIFSAPDIEVEKSGKRYISADMVKEITAGYSQPEYKNILRKTYPGAARGCSEMIHTKDGWEGLGFFKHRPSLEACLKYCERKGVDPKNCPCEDLFKGAQ